MQAYLFAIDHYGLSLEVGLPDFLGVALAKADIIAKLLAFAGEFTLIHGIYSLDSDAYFN